MADLYEIYLVNQRETEETFWCFLSKPEVQVTVTTYANSSTSLRLSGKSTGRHKFVIPVQYVAGAGNTQKAVGLNVLVDSSDHKDLNMGETLEVKFPEPPPKAAAILQRQKDGAEDKISVKTLPFNPEKFKDNNWFPNLSFGIETQDGFIGMTWEPKPNQSYVIKPKLSFYVATGDYSENLLAEWASVSRDVPKIAADDFDSNKACTVTLKIDGSWDVKAGKPKMLLLEEAERSLGVNDLVNLLAAKTQGRRLESFNQY